LLTPMFSIEPFFFMDRIWPGRAEDRSDRIPNTAAVHAPNRIRQRRRVPRPGNAPKRSALDVPFAVFSALNPDRIPGKKCEEIHRKKRGFPPFPSYLFRL